MIFCKRVYDEVTESDGYRVLVDRLWPRGIKKTDLHYDEWNKDVAPDTDTAQVVSCHTLIHSNCRFVGRTQPAGSHTYVCSPPVFPCRLPAS